jgi:hypothetical protein
MLQGHFTDTMLARVHRDPAEPLYALWAFMRGMTAPIFFSVTGLVFVFLLLKEDQDCWWRNPRALKGLRRGLFLVFVGYLLKLHFPGLLKGKLWASTFVVDVLHIIGISLLALIGLYAIARLARLSLPLLLAIGGVSFFLLNPSMRAIDWTFLPYYLANYFTKANGSIFTIIPWVGYAMLGGVLGWHARRHTELYRTYWWPGFLLLAGLMIHFSSARIMENLYQLSGWRNFEILAGGNNLFWRFGQVLVVVALFVWIEQYFKRFPRLFLKIGMETLTVYNVHYILLYGTWFGVGLNTYWKGQLNPIENTIGAALFLAFFILLIAHIDRIRALPGLAYQVLLALPWQQWRGQAAYLSRFIWVMGRRRTRQWALFIKTAFLNLFPARATG